MTQPDPNRLRVADLSQNRPSPFELRPDSNRLRQLAEDLGLLDLRKMRFAGEISAHGDEDWLLEGQLGATVVQACVVSLAPVTTRIETPVRRLFLANMTESDLPEMEMPEDDTTEPLPAFLDLTEIMAEALALALPLYPRAKGASLEETGFAPPGVTPMRDEDTRPFAGLAGLRDQLADKE